MKRAKTYVPATYTPGDSSEFHRIREWWNCYHAVVSGLISGNGVYGLDAEDRRGIRRQARRFANSVHGRIEPKPTWRLSELYDRRFLTLQE